jgi:hypothetical protein
LIVGWVEPTGRANARQMRGFAKPTIQVMGFAALYPSYLLTQSKQPRNVVAILFGKDDRKWMIIRYL